MLPRSVKREKLQEPRPPSLKQILGPAQRLVKAMVAATLNQLRHQELTLMQSTEKESVSESCSEEGWWLVRWRKATMWQTFARKSPTQGHPSFRSHLWKAHPPQQSRRRFHRTNL
jgi:hypothetical protein